MQIMQTETARDTNGTWGSIKYKQYVFFFKTAVFAYSVYCYVLT